MSGYFIKTVMMYPNTVQDYTAGTGREVSAAAETLPALRRRRAGRHILSDFVLFPAAVSAESCSDAKKAQHMSVLNILFFKYNYGNRKRGS